MITSFPKKVETTADDIDRGDIVLFQPLKTNDAQRGIVYSRLYAENGRIVGFLVLPLDTTGKKKAVEAPYPAKEITHTEMIVQAGANPALQKGVVTFNLRTVALHEQMTTLPRGQIYKIGSYHGLPFMTELMEEAQRLYTSGNLHKDGKLLKAHESRFVQPPQLAKKDTREIRAARAKAHEALDANRNVGTKTPIGATVTPTLSITTKEAFEKGHLDGRTILTLLHYSMKHDYFPETLRAAYTLANQKGKELRTLEGPLLEKDDAKNAIADIKQAARHFGIK